jgi:hypothetical protein
MRSPDWHKLKPYGSENRKLSTCSVPEYTTLPKAFFPNLHLSFVIYLLRENAQNKNVYLYYNGI